jgi:hypothetical protein
MKEAAEPQAALAPAVSAPERASGVPAAVGMVLQMQTTHGNAHVARLLAQQRAGVLGRMPIRRGAGHGSLAEAETAQVYEQPSESSKVVGELAKGKTVDLTSDDGGFYGVVFDATKGYVKSSELATAIDELPAAKDAEFAARAKAAEDAIDAAGHAAGKALRGKGTAPAGTGGALPGWFRELQFKLSMVTTWAKEEETAQQVIDDYMTYYMEAWHGDVPPSLKYLFQYAGRSSINQSSAAKGGFDSVGKFGGGINDKGKPNPNWCTQTSSSAIVNALRDMGYAPTTQKIEQFLNNIAYQKSAKGVPNAMSGSSAFTAPLYPGDQVMYLFDGCQYGGHTVTVVDDLGDSFLHISGNTGDAIAVGIGEAQRLKSEPKVKSGGSFKLAECNKVASAEERDASTAYIKGLDFGGKVLTYSIIRDSAFFAEIESIPELPEEEQNKLLAKYKLRRVTVST